MSTEPLTALGSWTALERHYEQIRGVHLRDLFAADPGRGERLTAEAAGLFLDYSKHRVTAETLQRLLGLAEESGLRGRIDAMFRGDAINVTEHRAVLHVALRAPRGTRIESRAQTSSPGARRAGPDGGLHRRARPRRRVEGLCGQRIRAVVNIGSAAPTSGR